MIPVERWEAAGSLTLEPNALIAAKTTDRHLALTAGPGAGKTEVLAQRADFLLRTGTSRYPSRILAIAFKVDASQNLRNRVRQRCGPELASRLDSLTFHAFAKGIIDKFRTSLVGADQLNADYSIGERRVQGQSIRFQDMVPLATTIVQTSQFARNAVRYTYSHVFLDEFQDCTAEQYEFIRTCFAGTSVQLTAVGDTRQRIMGWAGALEGIFDKYASEFGPLSLSLYQNFRSRPRLRRMQNAMVRKMDPKAALDEDALPGEEGVIGFIQGADATKEAELVAASVKSRIGDDGVAPSEIAILVSRDQQYFCQPLRLALQAAGIPFREEDDVHIFANEPIAKVITDLLLVAGTTASPEAHKRLLNALVYSQAMDDEQEYRARSRWNRFVTDVQSAITQGAIVGGDRDGLRKIIDDLFTVVGRDAIVAMSNDYAYGSRLDELVEEALERLHTLLAAGTDIGTALSAFSADKAVRVMSIHKSKGLEFDTVYVLGVEQETFWGDADDQRSAFFVAISRAKERLILTMASVRERPDGWPRWRWDRVRNPHVEFLEYAAPYCNA